MSEPSLQPVRAWIALGSNLEHPQQQVESAVSSIEQLPTTNVIAQSSWYRSRAIGPGEQPDYINGVLEVHTRLTAIDLLDALQAIENAHGRVRTQRWGARTLDLDILLYGEKTMTSDRLQVPHPRLAERNFVLYPLAEIAPQLVLPDGSQVAALAARLNWDGLEKL